MRDPLWRLPPGFVPTAHSLGVLLMKVRLLPFGLTPLETPNAHPITMQIRSPALSPRAPKQDEAATEWEH